MSSAEIARADAAARAENIRTTTGHLLQTMADAWDQQDHLTLGYGSWAEYCRVEFDGRIALPRTRGDRRDLVRALSEAGLSQRAVAAATGMSRNTVARYVAPEVAQFEPPVVEHQDLTEAEARDLTDRLREALDPGRSAYRELQASPNVMDVLMDPWVIRAIQLGSLTPVEAVEAWDRVKNGPRADINDSEQQDDHILELIIIELLTRTGRYVGGWDPSIPLAEAVARREETAGGVA